VEIDGTQRIFRTGQRVVDLGCWPGGWLQVAAEKVGPSGRVAGIDLAPIDPPLDLDNVFAMAGDLASPSAFPPLLEYLGGRADVLLSDAAPKLSGVRASDRAREEALLEAVGVAMAELLRPGGLALVKLLDCPEAQAFEKRLRRRFSKARKVRPKASRKGSSETYLLAREYQGE
jgi:23S rRNA (uridine2552-2'-O)-methyltransferase